MRKITLNNKASMIIFLTVFAAGMFSCQTDLLDPLPKNSLSDKLVFDTPARIELQVNSLYTFMKAGNFLGGRFQIYNDIRVNDFINRTSNGVTGYSVWNHTLTENSQNDVINLWAAAYAAINQINVFLAGIDENESKFVAPTFAADFATTTAVQYRAEARLLRGLAYHCLLQLYAKPFADGNGTMPGLPLRLLAEKNALNNNLGRSTVAEIYTQILDDLNFAEQNLPLTYGTATLRVTRAHKNTAIALKTRVYLTKGDYGNVIGEANKIVSNTAPFTAAASGGVAHALQSSIATVFAVPQETTESIFSLPFTAQNTPGTQNQLAYYYRSSATTSPNPGGGEYSLSATGIIAANPLWPATDARRNFVYAVGTESFLGKYPSGTPFTDKAPVIRYAEVLLNLSEAIARSSAGVDARSLALLNAVRQRSQASFIWAPADNAALVAAIMLERRIEFLGEGIRNMDIMRLNAPIPGKGAVGAVNPTDLAYVWPIPSTEMAANALMTRN
jgi:hypothetical protein